MQDRPRASLFSCFSSRKRREQVVVHEDKHRMLAKEFLSHKGMNQAEIKAELVYLHGREAYLLYRCFQYGLRGKTIRDLKHTLPDFTERMNQLLYPNDIPHSYFHEILRIILSDKKCDIPGLVAFFSISNVEKLEDQLESIRKVTNSYLEAVYALKEANVTPSMRNPGQP